MKGTTKELAAHYKMEQPQMSGALTFLLKVGLATVEGEEPKEPGQRGKAAKIYEINENVSIADMKKGK